MLVAMKGRVVVLLLVAVEGVVLVDVGGMVLVLLLVGVGGIHPRVIVPFSHPVPMI